MKKGDHRQVALRFLLVDDRWKSSYRSRWIRGVYEVSGTLMMKRLVPDGSCMAKKGSHQGFLGN